MRVNAALTVLWSALLPLIFRGAYVTVTQVCEDLGVTTQGARNLLQRAKAYEWLVPVGTVGRSGRAVWVAADVLRVIDSPLSYDTQTAPTIG